MEMVLPALLTTVVAYLIGFDANFACVLVMSALLVWRHRANIARLLAGTESRIGGNKA